jgi:uncharacterized protein (DUF2126 family)
MKPLRDLAAIAALAALALAGVRLAFLFRTTEKTVERIPALIAAEGDRTRIAALIAIAETRADVLARVDALSIVAQQELRATRTEASAHIVGLAGVLDGRLESIEVNADRQLTHLNLALTAEMERAGDQIADVSTELQATLAESRRTVHDLHPQLLGLVAASKVAAGELATSGREFQRAMPVYTALGEKIGGNVDLFMVSATNTAKNIESLTKPRWYDRVLGYTLNGVVMYRNLNPVTNLTLKGAQIISSRP